MKQKIINMLSSFCNKNKSLIAGFISGSFAFKRDDELSDIDLRIVADEQNFDSIFFDFECFLDSSIGIRERYTPKYSIYTQRFYKLNKISDFNMIDVVILSKENLFPFLDKNRMGYYLIVLYDKFNIIQQADTPEDIYEKFSERIEDLQQQFFFLSIVLVERAIKRKRYTEAVYFYNTRVIKPLVEVLRYKYCPARQDFGLRYLEYDLAPSILNVVDKLHMIFSFEDIKNNLKIATKLFEETLDSLDLLRKLEPET